jgi:hypothetical protein
MRVQNHALTDGAFAQLRKVIQQLGQGGGSMTPSVYETAQVLRFCPEIVQVDKVVDWLLRRQQADGGWGDPATPLYRDVPTLAALLALQDYRQHKRVRRATNAAQRFMEEQITVIEPTDREYLPVGVELIIPRMLGQAEEAGLVLSRARYQYLEELNARRRILLAQHPPAVNSSAVFSWEAWGNCPDERLVGSAGVGHNPAATAWWLHLDRKGIMTSARQKAIGAIVNASRAAGTSIIGVVPDAWPMNRFEQSFVLHLISIAGLIKSHQLADVLAPKLESLRLALTSSGLGFSDDFEPDGDDTAAAVAALAAGGFPVDYAVLSPFARPDRFVAYPFETHGSFTVTARASQAARTIGCDTARWRPYILSAQQTDGWWPSDKWNRSKLYGTCVALAALDDHADAEKSAAAEALLRDQHADGGWGFFGQSTLVETAYGVLALCRIALDSGCYAECVSAIGAAREYLHRMYNVHRIGSEHVWVCKDLFSARRIDHAAVLCAMLTSNMSPHLHLGQREHSRHQRRQMVAQ